MILQHSLQNNWRIQAWENSHIDYNVRVNLISTFFFKESIFLLQKQMEKHTTDRKDDVIFKLLKCTARNGK